MTESEIRTTAQAHGLEVLKRITTGSEKRHFATFELSGESQAVLAAWPTVRDRAPRNFGKLLHVSNPDHQDKDQPYLEIDSVWREDLS